jgi:energy-coupling factor transport system permease protein
LNPLTWLAGNAMLLAFLLVWKRPQTPALAGVLLLLIGGAFGTSPFAQLRRLAPYLLVAAIWAATSALFYSPSPGERLHMWARVGPFPIYYEALGWGSLRALRLLDMIAYGSLLLARVRPDDLALALAQNARLPYRYAFTLQAAYRMIPGLSDEAEQVRRAQIVRGIPQPRGPFGSLTGWMRSAGPLLAGALRRADRLALAMESRGFGAYPDRTYRRRMAFHFRDAVFLLFWLLALIALTLR